MQGSAIDGPEQLTQVISVSRETAGRLKIFHDLLLKWQSRINLISPSTIDTIWQRHITDSAQLVNYIPESSIRLLDIGSGAGFPGIVLAMIMGKGDREWLLVESDQRKAVFLREALRLTETKARVINNRIERIEPLAVDVITARALAPLTQLLEWSLPHMKKNTICLFLKGKNCIKEIGEAVNTGWQFGYKIEKSITDSNGVVLIITDITKG